MKYDQRKAILDGIEFRLSKMIYKDIYIKVHGFEVGTWYVRQCHSASSGPQLLQMHFLAT